jgi:hypothetical protein
LLCWFRCASFQPIQFLLIHSSLGYGTSVPTPRITGDFAFPFFFFAFVVEFYLVCRFSIFSSRFQPWRSLPLHSHVGQATKFIYAAVSPFHIFSAVGLSEPC